VTINLAPADLRKEGSGFDLPMALGVVGCQGQFFGKALDQMMFLGELSLDGSVAECEELYRPPLRPEKEV
jgi:magnesium chelatase family protein